jgi:hypothetical protein
MEHHHNQCPSAAALHSLVTTAHHEICGREWIRRTPSDSLNPSHRSQDERRLFNEVYEPMDRTAMDPIHKP